MPPRGRDLPVPARIVEDEGPPAVFAECPPGMGFSMPPVRRGLSNQVRLELAADEKPRAPRRPPALKSVPTPEPPAPEAPIPAGAPLAASAAEPDPPEAADAGNGSETATVDLADIVRWAALFAAKAATIGFGIDALLHADSRRFAGKGMRLRAIGYLGTLFVVPLAWRLLPNRGRYPRGLDTAVTIPLLLDAAGNGLGIYEDAHVDDLVHIANGAIVSGIAGALFAPRVDERWQAALAATGLSITAETLWEIMEYAAWRLGANGLNLSYPDTMDDIIESALGAIAGGLFTLTRVPRSREERKRVGWRAPLGA